MRLIAIMLALLSLQWFEGRVVLVTADVATAASYGPPYTPTKCNRNGEGQFPPNNMFAAVCDGLWNNGAACGRKYMVRCLSGSNRPCKEEVSIVVAVVDKCSQNPCPADLLLSRDAFDAISQSTNGKINVEYIQI